MQWTPTFDSAAANQKIWPPERRGRRLRLGDTLVAYDHGSFTTPGLHAVELSRKNSVAQAGGSWHALTSIAVLQNPSILRTTRHTM